MLRKSVKPSNHVPPITLMIMSSPVTLVDLFLSVHTKICSQLLHLNDRLWQLRKESFYNFMNDRAKQNLFILTQMQKAYNLVCFCSLTIFSMLSFVTHNHKLTQDFKILNTLNKWDIFFDSWTMAIQ